MHPHSELGVRPPRWQGPPSPAELRSPIGQRSIVLALLATIVVLDQSAKWWAWRHVPTFINHGGDILVGATVNAWFADPVQGMLLDLVDCGLLSIGFSVLWRRRRSLFVLVSGGMTLGGWTSNLLDRLFMHSYTAPGTGRGAVDFIPIGPHHYNVADLFIIAGTPLFALAVGVRYLRQRLRNLAPTAQRLAATRASSFGGEVNSLAVVRVGATDDKQ